MCVEMVKHLLVLSDRASCSFQCEPGYIQQDVLFRRVREVAKSNR